MPTSVVIRITVYGTLVAGVGIYDPSQVHDGYDIFIARTGSITAMNGYGIALQDAATVIDRGSISATEAGINTGTSTARSSTPARSRRDRHSRLRRPNGRQQQRRDRRDRERDRRDR